MKALKFLTAGGVGRFSDFRWPQPDALVPGAWVETSGVLEECRSGVHACRGEQLLDWLDDELWEIELDRVDITSDGGLVAARGRLLRRVESWDTATACTFAAACAGRTRAHGVAELRRAGQIEAARALAAAAGPAALKAIAAGATDARVSEAAGFAADTLLLASGARPDEPGDGVVPGAAMPSAAAIAANVGFVSAHATARIRGGDDAEAYGVAFTRERDWQLRFLGGLLDLAG